MFKQIQIKDSTISYQVIGSGKPVMLVHGFGEDSSVWKNQVEYLKEKVQLIIPDLPGSGRSGMVDDMSIEGMAEILKLILDAETKNSITIENFNINDSSQVSPFGGDLEGASANSQVPPPGGFRGAMIGHSMGGYITLAFAEKYAGHLSGFGLFHSSAYADSEEKKATRRKGIDFIREHGAFAFLKTATPNLFSLQSRDEQALLIDNFVAGLNNFSADALVSYYEAMMARPDRTDLLRNSSVPVLFIMGKYDVAVPVEDSLSQSYLPENAYIHILRHSGHMGMLEEPGICNMALEKFLL